MNAPNTYVPQTGNMIAGLGNRVMEFGAQLPGVFEQSRVWNENKALHKSTEDFKNNLIQTVETDMRKHGIDPATVDLRGIASTTKTAEEFAQKAGLAIAPLFKSVDGRQGTLGEESAGRFGMASHPEVKESLGQQKANRAYQGISQEFDTRFPAEQAQQNPNAGLFEDAIGSPQPIEMPKLSPDEEERQIKIDNIRSIQRMVAEKTIDPTVGSQMIFDGMKALDEMKVLNKKAEIEGIKERNKRAAETLSQGGLKGGTLSKGGQNVPFEPLAIEADPSGMTIEFPTKEDGSGGSGGSGSSETKQKFEEKEFLAKRIKDSETLARQMYNGVDEFGNKVLYDQNKYDNVMKEIVTNKLAYLLHNSNVSLNEAESIANTSANTQFSYDPPERNDSPLVRDKKSGKWSLSLQYPGILEQLAKSAINQRDANLVLNYFISRRFPSSATSKANQPE